MTPDEVSIVPGDHVRVGKKKWVVGALVQTGGERYLLLHDQGGTVFLCPRRDATRLM